MPSPKDLRQYARISVDYPVNMKLSGASPEAKWLGITGILWSLQNFTDGEVAATVIAATAEVPSRRAQELVKRGAWHKAGHDCPDCPQPTTTGRLVIHHFLKHQDSAEAIRQARDDKAKAGRLANHIRWKHVGPIEECPKCTE